jgi:Ca2+-binding RTX toxin-like protein
VKSISVTGGKALNGLVIWLSQTPAATTASPPSPLGGPLANWGSISWTIDLGSTKGDAVVVVDAGATRGIDLTMGDSGIDLNGDGHVDVIYTGVSLFEILVAGTGSKAASNISAAGSNATGGPATLRVVILMLDHANDILTGGNRGDLISGGGGNDRISGGGGNDTINGGGGNDRINGGPGKDTINGGPGRDVCSGGPGKDKVSCEVGRAA